MIAQYARKYHKWLMLCVGLQFLIWSVTGLYMVTMNIHFIHGETLLKDHQSTNKLALDHIKVDFNTLINRYPSATNISLEMRLGKPVYQFKIGEETHLVSAEHGQLIPLINEETAEKIAIYNSIHKYTVESTVLLHLKAPPELSKRHLPVWKVTFKHFSSPTFYISQQSGQIVTKRHVYWRVFDWMWRFHIMDYDDGENVSNAFLFIVQLLGLFAVISGGILTYVYVVKPLVSKKNKALSNKKTRRRSLSSLNKLVHKWLSLLIGIQLIIWVVTGLYFNLMDHDKASGNVNRHYSEPVNNVEKYSFIIDKLKQLKAFSIHLVWILDKPYYSVILKKSSHSYQKNNALLFDVVTGKPFQLSTHLVNDIADRSYKSKAIIKHTTLLTPPISALPNERNQVWQIQLKDKNNTTVYIRHSNGDVISHVTDDKRIRDFMFKLHFMDYGNEGSFNNIQINVFAFIMLILSITGSYWLIQRFKNIRFIR